jgi:hypothetical protein
LVKDDGLMLELLALPNGTISAQLQALAAQSPRAQALQNLIDAATDGDASDFKDALLAWNGKAIFAPGRRALVDIVCDIGTTTEIGRLALLQDPEATGAYVLPATCQEDHLAATKSNFRFYWGFGLGLRNQTVDLDWGNGTSSTSSLLTVGTIHLGFSLLDHATLYVNLESAFHPGNSDFTIATTDTTGAPQTVSDYFGMGLYLGYGIGLHWSPGPFLQAEMSQLVNSGYYPDRDYSDEFQNGGWYQTASSKDAKWRLSWMVSAGWEWRADSKDPFGYALVATIHRSIAQNDLEYFNTIPSKTVQADVRFTQTQIGLEFRIHRR